MHKGKIKGLATRGQEIAFGTFAIKSLNSFASSSLIIPLLKFSWKLGKLKCPKMFAEWRGKRLNAASRENFAPNLPGEVEINNIGLSWNTLLFNREHQSNVFLNAAE